ncbi:NTP transferase domain-containing protein [Danxiaibacter flavus]|uniref:NTP transferase domain-containing protein n=1 Tax=Danxiaibacter flavus TaxID=3049108 RepID=A0ABV3ZML5_9BACT|nr:NTP transferase domain-containing protein [Chitinophagaceae bacterium DXS]
MTLNENKAPLYALILCGGYSRRMQTDKFLISYHDGIPQWLYLYNMLKPLLQDVFISCRPDQHQFFGENYRIIEDMAEGKGPAMGLVSAHEKDPDAAWLVVACDLPLLTDHTLRLLIDNRNASKSATSFVSPENHLPEPLIAIWEPAGLALLKENYKNDLFCPRKTLLSTDILLLTNDNPEEQLNANTPEERQDVIRMLG